MGYFLEQYLRINNYVETFENISKSKINFAIKDLSKLVIDFDRYDVIINLIHDHSNDIDKNLHVINLILERIKPNQKLIYFSSSQVTEENSNKYTLIKSKIEKLIKKNNLNYIILRPSLILEEKVYNKTAKEQFLIKLLEIIKKYKIAIMLANGQFYLNLVSVFDLDQVIQKIINEDLKNKTIDIFNETSLTFLDIVNIINSEFKINFFKIHIPLFILKLLALVFTKKISSENIKALKFFPTKFQDLENDNTKFQNYQKNIDILRKLFQSI